MYAVAVDRTRQIRLQEGQKILLDYNQGWEAGAEVVLDQVCLLGTDDGTKIGTPYVDGAKVTLEVVGEEAGEKLVIGKFKRRKCYRRKTGFRAKYTQVVVKSIQG
jgi:large subunit ribosomal protein L21